MSACLNCGKSLKPKHRFCPKCGQSAKVGRLQVGDPLKHAISKVVHADSNVLAVLKGLAVRPGFTVLEYPAGKRKRYYSPLKFLLLTSGISVFINHSFHLLESMPAAAGNAVNELAARNFNLLILLDASMLAALTLIFWRKKGFT